MVLWKGFSNFVQSFRTKVVLQPIVGVSSEADVENERTLGILASKNKPTILMSEDSVSIYDCILLQKLWQSSKPKERLRVAMANPQKGDDPRPRLPPRPSTVETWDTVCDVCFG